MGETDGKVKDNATRDGLQSTINDAAKTIDEAREAVKNHSHVGDDRKWNIDEEKKLTDSVNALGEKSNQVHDSHGQWEAEQAAAASSNAGSSSYSNAGGSYSRSAGSTAGRSYSINGGGSASRSTGSANASQGGSSSSGQSYWVKTETMDPSLGWTCSGSLGSDPTHCWGNDGKEMHRGANGIWH